MFLTDQYIKDNIEDIDKIDALSDELKHRFKDIIVEDANLSRQLVSFKANKQLPIYRWYKYKEAFSANLIHYLFNPYTFFIGAAIEKDMADEIFKQLKDNVLAFAGNLTLEEHLVEICNWLISL
jgi:hypothetical protein